MFFDNKRAYTVLPQHRISYWYPPEFFRRPDWISGGTSTFTRYIDSRPLSQSIYKRMLELGLPGLW